MAKVSSPKGMPDVNRAGKVADISSPGVKNGAGTTPIGSSMGGAIAHTGSMPGIKVPSHGNAPKDVGSDWAKCPSSSIPGAIDHSGPAKQ